jgi:septum formation protein
MRRFSGRLAVGCHNSNMLVLASASPRRRELLAQAGFNFQVHPAHIPEDPLVGEDPIAYVIRLAREKAQVVFRALNAAKSAQTLRLRSTRSSWASRKTLPTPRARCECSRGGHITS